jgi:hypothetical protein
MEHEIISMLKNPFHIEVEQKKKISYVVDLFPVALVYILQASVAFQHFY